MTNLQDSNQSLIYFNIRNFTRGIEVLLDPLDIISLSVLQ